MNATANAALIDKPNEHDIEAVRPFQRKHMRPWKLLINESEVTINGATPKDAMKRFRAMTDGSVAFVLAPTTTKKGKR